MLFQLINAQMIWEPIEEVGYAWQRSFVTLDDYTALSVQFERPQTFRIETPETLLVFWFHDKNSAQEKREGMDTSQDVHPQVSVGSSRSAETVSWPAPSFRETRHLVVNESA
jgi:hypothetical protein